MKFVIYPCPNLATACWKLNKCSCSCRPRGAGGDLQSTMHLRVGSWSRGLGSKPIPPRSKVVWRLSVAAAWCPGHRHGGEPAGISAQRPQPRHPDPPRARMMRPSPRLSCGPLHRGGAPARPSRHRRAATSLRASARAPGVARMGASRHPPLLPPPPPRADHRPPSAPTPVAACLPRRLQQQQLHLAKPTALPARARTVTRTPAQKPLTTL